jgi:TonB family protein
MRKYLFIILFLLVSYSIVRGQTPLSAAPIKWQQYSIPEKKVSISLPKLPVRFDTIDLCNEMAQDILYAYADETVYEFRIITKNSENIPAWCTEKTSFGSLSLKKRMAEIETKDTKPASFEKDETGRSISKTKAPSWIRWVIDDLKNKRWIELCMSRRGGLSEMDANFASSFRLNEISGAVDVGKGSSVTLGDETLTEGDAAPLNTKPSNEPPKSEPLMLIAKHRPPYTDAARRASTQGFVQLRVTFLSNGGIGSVSVVRELPHGLTEQAIAFAKRLVFIPAKTNGARINVVKTLEYGFHIY